MMAFATWSCSMTSNSDRPSHSNKSRMPSVVRLAVLALTVHDGGVVGWFFSDDEETDPASKLIDGWCR